MRLGLRSSLLASLAAGCTYVSQGDYDEFRNKLDEDGDGALWKDDCDDKDPLRGGADEIPYDGIDNDCSLEQGSNVDAADVDTDADGFPRLTEEEYAALKPQLDYPPAFVGKPVDCDDTDPLVNPLNTSDAPYDGIDSDCSGNLDFDQDIDGYYANLRGDGSPIAQADIDAYIAKYAFTAEQVGAWGPGGTGGPLPGDCEDSIVQFNPAAASDTPYTGVDENCDGKDEFDQDDDGFVPIGMGQRWLDFQQRYSLPTDPVKPPTDCADGPEVPEVSPGFPYEPLLAIAVAKDVYPGAPDAPYDGIDSDCDRLNDFDADGDSYVETTNLVAMGTYVDEWGYDDEPWVADLGGDCDDDNEDFHPGVLDILWSTEDEDCDGRIDTSAFSFGDAVVPSLDDCPGGNGAKGTLCWTGPSNPELRWFNDTEFVLLVSAMEFWDTSVSPQQHEVLAGASLRFGSPSAIGPAIPDQIDGRSWMRAFPANPTQILSPFLDLAVDPTPGENKCTVAAGSSDVCDWLTIAGNDGIDGELNSALIYANNNLFTAQPQARGLTTLTTTVLDGDAAAIEVGKFDVGVSVQCGPERVHGDLSNTVQSYVSADVDALGGDVCFFYDDPASTPEPQVEVCNAGSCFVVEFVTDLVNNHFVQVATLPTEHWIWGDREDRLTLLIDPSNAGFVRADGTTALTPVFAGESLESFDLEAVGAVWYMAAITTDGRVLFAVRDGAGGVLDIELDAEDSSNPSWVPSGISVAVAPDRVGVAVTRTDPLAAAPRPGSIGWTFLGLP